MTDAREIIVKWAWGTETSARGNATMALRELSNAGFRILGPDEVDPVTLEKCAEVAAGFADQTDYDLEPEAAVAENVTAKMIAAAIRSLGRKA